MWHFSATWIKTPSKIVIRGKSSGFVSQSLVRLGYKFWAIPPHQVWADQIGPTLANQSGAVFSCIRFIFMLTTH
jgi:hypothetical protein